MRKEEQHKAKAHTGAVIFVWAVGAVSNLITASAYVHTQTIPTLEFILSGAIPDRASVRTWKSAWQDLLLLKISFSLHFHRNKNFCLVCIQILLFKVSEVVNLSGSWLLCNLHTHNTQASFKALYVILCSMVCNLLSVVLSNGKHSMLYNFC